MINLGKHYFKCRVFFLTYDECFENKGIIDHNTVLTEQFMFFWLVKFQNEENKIEFILPHSVDGSTLLISNFTVSRWLYNRTLRYLIINCLYSDFLIDWFKVWMKYYPSFGLWWLIIKTTALTGQFVFCDLAKFQWRKKGLMFFSVWPYGCILI